MLLENVVIKYRKVLKIKKVSNRFKFDVNSRLRFHTAAVHRQFQYGSLRTNDGQNNSRIKNNYAVITYVLFTYNR